MSIAVHNLLHSPGDSAHGEEIKTIFSSSGVRIEQIVSHGQPSPDGFWYDQPDPEWVVLLKGSATLLVEGQSAVELSEGDYLLIPAKVRHRVDRVSADALWLAVHCVG
jgi:cupin 2 domain-containing protein